MALNFSYDPNILIDLSSLSCYVLTTWELESTQIYILFLSVWDEDQNDLENGCISCLRHP